MNGWRSVKDLRDELRFPSDEACRVWLKRQGIATVKRGRIILVSNVDIDAALHPVTQRTRPRLVVRGRR